MNDMTRVSEPFGAVLVIRIWFESHPGSSTLRARILHADDPVRADIDSVVVSGVQKTAEVISKWLSDYVADCQRQAAIGPRHTRGHKSLPPPGPLQAASLPTQIRNEGFVAPIEADNGEHPDSDAPRGGADQDRIEDG
jgi:hypothetical protein